MLLAEYPSNTTSAQAQPQRANAVVRVDDRHPMLPPTVLDALIRSLSDNGASRGKVRALTKSAARSSYRAAIIVGYAGRTAYLAVEPECRWGSASG